MTYTVYILQSASTSKIYIGQTSNLKRRIQEHNDPQWGSSRRYTKKDPGPWVLVHEEHFSYRSDAMKREKNTEDRSRQAVS